VKRIVPFVFFVATVACTDVPNIKDYCAAQAASGHPCITNWSNAPASGDQYCVAGREQYSVAEFRTCKGTNVVVLASVDTSETFFYDSASGALIGINTTSPVQTSTIAGTIPNIDLSACSLLNTVTCIRP
jgi:hypothetical protein